MKRIFTTFAAVVVSVCLFAQAPQKMSYQSVIRDLSNHLVTTQVGMRISILQGSETGTPSYVETQTPTPNANGLVTIQIGDGDPVAFAAINWAAGPYYIKTETATEAPLTTYTIEGTSQILSVPYALHAKTVASYPETDPVFGAHAANGITSTLIGNWNTAFGWGNHATAGYLTIFTEVDPAVTSHFDFTGAATNDLLKFNGTKWVKFTPNYLTSFTETDPIFGAHAANGITSTLIGNWNTAYSWGTHTGLYKLISYIPDWSELINKPFDLSSPLNNQLLKYNTTSSKWENWTPDFLTTETQSLTLNTNQLSISGAGGNTITFTNWDTDKTDDVTLAAPVNGDMLYFNGTSWTAVPKGTTGQVLTMNASGVPEWQDTYTFPTASTQAATFSLPSAIFNGVVNPNKLPATVTFQYGTTISYGSTATAIQSPINGSSNTNVNCSVSGLVAGTIYHFRVKAENAFGITYGDDMTFTLLGNGITWEGGLIFYLDASGMHGLTAAPGDQGSSDWGCYPSVISGADGTIVGRGNQNTLDIVAGCTTIGIAAEICSSLTLNGYSDWFLPSKDELGLMYTNLYLAGKGSFGTTLFYWSSSEYNINYSYRLNFSGGVSGTSLKNSTQYVRAVRAF